MSIQVKDALGTNQTVETPAAAGRVNATASKPTAWSHEDLAAIGATNEALPTGDGGTSGLNGRLQRIATNLTAYLSGFQAKFPAALGTNGGLKVDSAGASIPVSGTVGVTGISSTPPSRGIGNSDADTLRVSIAQEQVEGGEYRDIASSTSSAALLGTGAVGDFLSSILIVPETLNPGQITLKDGSLTPVVVFQGGTGSVSNLVPFSIPFGHGCVNATTPGWRVTTGADVHIRAIGNFT